MILFSVTSIRSNTTCLIEADESGVSVEVRRSRQVVGKVLSPMEADFSVIDPILLLVRSCIRELDEEDMSQYEPDPGDLDD